MVESDPEATRLLESLAENGQTPVSNAWMAGRWDPPPVSAGLFPAPKDDQPGYYNLYNNGEITQNLKGQLPEPMANPTNAFSKVASADAPGLSTIYVSNLELK